MATGNDADTAQGAGGGHDSRLGRRLSSVGGVVGLLGILLVLIGGIDPGVVPSVTRVDSYVIATGIGLVVAGTLMTYLCKRFGY